MKSPMTSSCICFVLEKQMVRRTNRLSRVRQLMCLLSIFWVFAFRVFLSIQMRLVSPPAIRVIARDAQRLSPRFELHKDGVLASSKHLSQHLARVLITRVPKPSRRRLAGDKPPPCVAL
jgi:hypothetical protein